MAQRASWFPVGGALDKNLEALQKLQQTVVVIKCGEV